MARPKKIQPTEDNIHEITPPSSNEVGFATPSGDVGFNRDNVNITITDEERERFFKCFISDTRFEDEKELFDGKVKVSFKSITVEENNDIWRQVNLDSKIGEIANNQEAYLLLINLYRMTMALDTIEGMPFDSVIITKEKFESIDPNITYVKAKADKFKNWDTFKLSSFIRAFNEFENKIYQLEKDVTTQNFWKAAV